jgi:hypothetical protein
MQLFIFLHQKLIGGEHQQDEQRQSDQQQEQGRT